MVDRVIFHCDCNSFYASVELLDRPDIAQKPVAVAGSVDDRHGIILAKNEAAKKYGVQTAETVWQAKRKCPGLILLPPHHGEYRRFSKIINSIYEAFTDLVEPFGIDESWLDVTGSWMLFGKSPHEVADLVRRTVKERTGLTISVGVSFNKVFAKLGSDYKKPDAVTEITRENYKTLLWPLPVSALLYVGRRAQQGLRELGINTIGELAASDPVLLEEVFGKQGRMLYTYANGLDKEPVRQAGEYEMPKSVGNGLTFRRNLVGYKDLRTGVGALADEVAARLRRHKLYASVVVVQIKNPDLKSIVRQKTLDFSTNLEKDLTGAAMELIEENWDLTKPVRMLTVTAKGLTMEPSPTQTSLLAAAGQMDKRRQHLEESMDSIRQKYGRQSIISGGVLHNTIGLTDSADKEDAGEEDEGGG